jgi:23S rRNA (adenine2503-C2)-methyltransferase
MSAPPDPLGLSVSDWEALVQLWLLPRYRGRQIFDALHRRGRRDYALAREIPASLRERLAHEMPLRLPEIVRREESTDGSVKYGLRLSDGALVEAVFMPGSRSFSAANEFEDARASAGSPPVKDLPRAGVRRGTTDPLEKFTICVSSQTGCAVDCAFCVTGRLGGGRNLSAGEILGQLAVVRDDAGRALEGLRVVFMGMGEPFLNPDAVSGALDVLFELLPVRRVTVSTSGITPVFARFAARARRPNLAVSINASDSRTRARLMPIERTYPLSGVVAAMRAWPLESHRRMTAEYVLIAGVNDAPEDAARLAKLLASLRIKVNAIPLNEDPIYLPGWKRPSEAAIDRFASRLVEGGIPVTVRRSRGPDAKAACGQLKGRTEDIRRARSEISRTSS